MATVTTDDVDAIRRRMAKIRSELHEDVRGVVEAANSAWNWRRYITAYPMLSLSLAAGLGYLVVPRGRKSAPAPVVIVEKAAKAAGSVAAAPEREQRKKSLISAGVGMLATLALKSAQNYALHYAQQWLAEKQMQFMHGAESQGLIPTSVGMAPPYGGMPGAPGYDPRYGGRPQGPGPGAGPMPGRPAGPNSPWPGGA